MSVPVDLTLRPSATAARPAGCPHPGLALAAVYLLLNVVAVVAPGWLAHGDPLADPLSAQLGSSAEHWLGTDQLGRDIYSRVVYGARYSLSISVAAIGVATLFGTARAARRPRPRLARRADHARARRRVRVPRPAARADADLVHRPRRGEPGVRARRRVGARFARVRADLRRRILRLRRARAHARPRAGGAGLAPRAAARDRAGAGTRDDRPRHRDHRRVGPAFSAWGRNRLQPNGG